MTGSIELIQRALAHLRHQWAKNDGKPWEEWAPGRDLKEMALVVALVICTGLTALFVVVQVAG